MNLSSIEELSQKLENHPLFSRINSLPELRFFMRHHVYAVWDFMSLLKKLQQEFAPHGSPWLPSTHDGKLIRFINEIVMEEESDLSYGSEGESYSSHFGIYLASMEEVDCPIGEVSGFLEKVRTEGLEEALLSEEVPSPSRSFMKHTFEVIESGKPHEVAASFSLARESVIPLMFKRILDKTEVSAKEAPVFHYYLERHAELDGDHHGPMAKRILEELCAGDPIRENEVLEQAKASIRARILFWDEVLDELNRIRMPDPPLVVSA
ncbi:MAG: DUF3050 domain-containing protein [Verrucomicrobiota bacterium]|nr:DUF3050 domain-containing protein [Verrucomicrobiota bacterium]